MMRFFVLNMIYLYFIRNNSEECVGIFFSEDCLFPMSGRLNSFGKCRSK